MSTARENRSDVASRPSALGSPLQKVSEEPQPGHPCPDGGVRPTSFRIRQRFMRRCIRLMVVVVAISLTGAAVVIGSLQSASRPTTPVNLPKAVGIDAKLGQPVPLDLCFHDEQGHEVRLGDLIEDKPVILNLVQFECPMLCNMVMDGLVRSLRTLSFDVGNQFHVLTISFDPREGPQLAAAAKQSTLQRYRRDGAAAGWHFLTGDESSIRQLTESVGFRFAFDSRTGRFAHGAGLFVLTPAGRVSRYFSGVEFSGRDLRLGLIEASDEKIGSAGDHVMLLCYHYDPARGTYGLAIMNGVRFAGVVTVLSMLAGFCAMMRHERRMQTKQ
jgi:protein SCO1